MAKVINTIIEWVKGGWKALAYVSPEEKERRHIAYEKLLYDSLIDQGFSEEEALEFSKGVRIDMDKEEMANDGSH